MLGAAMLQWGRARASAEICQRPLEFFTLGGCFNGAALVRARKSGISQENPAVDYASMGPRSCERGNAPGARWARWNGRSFNGAALVRARKFAQSRPGCLPEQGFNGAALVRARKCVDPSW